MKKLILLTGLILISAVVLLQACKKEEGPLLVDDEEIITTSETVPTSESVTESTSEEPTQDERQPRIIPVPKNLVSDRIVQEYSYDDYFLDKDHAFVIDGSSIYYERQRNVNATEENDYEHSGSFLYCADIESGDTRLCCSIAECEHNSSDCGAYLCSGGLVQSFTVDDGILWYIWSNGSMDTAEYYISCMDLENERSRTPWKIELTLTASFETGSSRPMNTQCIFLNGTIVTLKSSASWNRAVFGEYGGTQGYTDHAVIEAWKIPDTMNTSDQETVLVKADEILDEKYPDMYRQRVFTQVYGESLYILQSGEKPENLKDPVETWNMQYGFSLLRWSPGDDVPELLAESNAYSVWNFCVTEEGIYMLEFEDMETVQLVRLDPESHSEDILASGDEWWQRNAKFTDSRIISFAEGDGGFSAQKSRSQVCRVYDFSGNLLTETIKPVIDPRIADPDKAQGLFSVRYTADENGVYMGWKEGVMYFPFNEDPVLYYGYNNP